jgi:hypothetical protein
MTPTRTAAADEWVKSVFGIDVAAFPDNGVASDGDTLVIDGVPPDAATAEATRTASLADPVGVLLPDIPEIPDNPVTGKFTCTVRIVNNTNNDLLLDTATASNLDHGKYDKFPPSKIEKGKEEEFVAIDAAVVLPGGIRTTGVEGRVRYFTDSAKKTSWTVHFDMPRAGKNSADSTVSGPDQDQFDKSDGPGKGATALFVFSLDQKGGVKPSPTPGGDSGVTASCRVSIVNQTQQTIFLRKQDKASGDYVTNPQPSLAPGASTQFVFAETPNSGDHGCRGLMSWDIGDPKSATWDLMWDNPKGSKNLTAGVLKPDDGTFHSLDQIDSGDENVPVTFTLSGGGTGPAPKPATNPVTCSIAVKNATNTTLTIRLLQPNSGEFKMGPQETIAAGDTALMTFTGPPKDPAQHASARLEWDVGDTTEATWTTAWDHAPGGPTSTDDSIVPSGSAFKSTTKTTAVGADVAIDFTLSGATGPGPKPSTAGDTIIFKNATNVALTLSESNAGPNDFKPALPKTIAAGQSATVSSTGTDETVKWQVGDPVGGVFTTWITNWNHRKGGSSGASATILPDKTFKAESPSVDGGDNVTITFTVSGGVEPPPDGDDEFVPPPRSKQPTLRKGDNNADGWVEYAQRLLNKNKMNVTVNGEFDAAMETKVKAFQGSHGCLPDGVIGNETWSVLREGPKEKIGTDGRAPHSFEQTDAQARFVTEKTDSTGYDVANDSWFIRIVSVGEQAIDKEVIEVKVTQPDGTAHTHHVPIGAAKFPSPDGQGNFHVPVIADFKRTFGLDKSGVDPLTCMIDTYLPEKLGGDRWTGKVVAA